MALRTFITINDSDTGCYQYYIVEYKAPTDIGFSRAPDAFGSPAVIDGLSDGVEYTIRITKVCCDGTLSTPVTTSYTPIAGMPFTIELYNNATPPPNDLDLNIDITLASPSQTFYSGSASAIFGGGIYNGTPMPADASMPASGDISFLNMLSNGKDLAYEINIYDGDDNPIMDSSFPYSGVAGSGSTISIPSVTYGTATSYKLIFDFTDTV